MFCNISMRTLKDRRTNHDQHDLSSDPEIQLLWEPSLLVQHLCCLFSSHSSTSGSLSGSIMGEVDGRRTLTGLELLPVYSIYIQLPGQSAVSWTLRMRTYR
jgi:hypothetical protein